MKEMSFWYSNMVQTTMMKKWGNVHWDIMMQAVVFQTYKYVSCVVCIALFCHLSPLLCPSVDAYALWPTNLRQIKMSMCSEGKNIFLASTCKLSGFFFFVKSGIKKTQAMCQYRQTVSPIDQQQTVIRVKLQLIKFLIHVPTEKHFSLPDKPQPSSFSSKGKTKCQ